MEKSTEVVDKISPQIKYINLTGRKKRKGLSKGGMPISLLDNTHRDHASKQCEFMTWNLFPIYEVMN